MTRHKTRNRPPWAVVGGLKHGWNQLGEGHGGLSGRYSPFLVGLACASVGGIKLALIRLKLLPNAAQPEHAERIVGT